MLPQGLTEYFFPHSSDAGSLTYRPQLLAKARMHHVHVKSQTDAWRTLSLLLPLSEERDAPAWDEGMRFAEDLPQSAADAAEGAAFAELPAALGDAKRLGSWQK
ncbi:MAG: hypothetical protein WC824_14145, partial [Bacteroidota bacterium]